VTGYLALADFHERFHADILNYHAATIAEYLNELRWGIYRYLHPVYLARIRRDVPMPGSYGYDIPKEISGELATECYWDLLNQARSEPYMRKFKVTRWLKMRY
jgi:hypothetical protein